MNPNRRSAIHVLHPALLALAGLLRLAGFAHADPVYLKDIKPLLQARCYDCHGALKQKAGLRLDTVALMIHGGKSGPAILRGNPDKSPLFQRVANPDPHERMPPEHEGEPLSPAQLATVRSWIASGAPAPADERPEADTRSHWAFRPRSRPPVPAVAHPDATRNQIGRAHV